MLIVVGSGRRIQVGDPLTFACCLVIVVTSATISTMGWIGDNQVVGLR